MGLDSNDSDRENKVSKITDSAEGKRCTMRIPGVCCYDNTKTVWAHIRGIRWGAGGSLKPPDIIGLYACQNCHDILDRRVKTDFDRDYIMQLAYEGHCESLSILWEEGII